MECSRFDTCRVIADLRYNRWFAISDKQAVRTAHALLHLERRGMECVVKPKWRVWAQNVWEQARVEDTLRDFTALEGFTIPRVSKTIMAG